MQENYHGRLFMTGILSLIFILVIILISVIFVTYRTGGQNQVVTTTKSTEETIQLVPTSSPVSKYHGSFMLHTENDQKEFSVGDTITVDVFADSDSQPVVGYDLDLDVVGGAQFAQADSMIDDFDMHPTKREGGVYLTSLKSLASQEPTIFADTTIATITFTATAPGTVMITPKFVVGETSHSNLMSVTSESVLGSVEGITVTVH